MRYSDDHPYVLRRHYLQLGWVIFKRGTKERVLHTPSKEHAEEVYNRLEKAVANGDKIIVTTKDQLMPEFEPKLLLIKGFRDETYILIDNEENFNKSFVKFIKFQIESEYGSLKRKTLSKSLLTLKENFLTDKQIEDLPTQALRNSVIESQIAYNAEVKVINTHNDIIDRMEKYLKDGNYKQLWHNFLLMQDTMYQYVEIMSFYGK